MVKMELTLENLVNEIVKKEYEYRSIMECSKDEFGIDSKEFHFWNAKRSTLYNIARKFGFVDKLKR